MTKQPRWHPWRSPAILLLVGSASLTACSTSSQQVVPSSSGDTGHSRINTLPTSAPTLQACPLLTVGEASTIMAGPVAPLAFCNLVAPDSSEALYLGTGTQHTSLLLKLYWSRQAATAYRAHHAAPGATGRPTAPPLLSSSTVSGIPAYWTTQPASTNGPTSGPQILTLTTSTHGYVVSMATQNLSQSQVAEAMALVLGRL